MEEKRIKYVSLDFPNTDDGTCIFYHVGKNDVTEIIKREYSPEPYCAKYYYEIHNSKGLMAELHQVTLVTYFQKEEAA